MNIQAGGQSVAIVKRPGTRRRGVHNWADELATDLGLVLRHHRSLRPEQMLALAVLEDGVLALRSPHPATRQEAIAWLTEPGVGDPLTLDWCCDALNLHVGWIRGRIRRNLQCSIGGENG